MGDRRRFHDRFDADVRRGRVVGSSGSDGVARLGTDRYRSMGVDHGALRITSLRRPGWGSTSLAYGPVEPRDGAAFAAFVSNGHNTAQSEPLGEPLATRLKRWLRGNGEEPWPAHVATWIVHGRRVWTLRRFAHWVRIDLETRRGTLLELDENLSVGLATDVASYPSAGGNSFVMHATGADNGELWVAARGSTCPVLTGVRNVPLYLLVVVRGDHVIHFGGSLSGVRGMPALPEVRPLAIVPLDETTRYATVHQSVSGQIGFAADSRVWETVGADVEEWLRGDGAPIVVHDLSALEPGGERAWVGDGGAGLIRVAGEPGARLAVSFRSSTSSGWAVRVGERGLELRHRDGDADRVVAETVLAIDAEQALDLQILDDGDRVGVMVNGALAFERWFDDVITADGDEGAVSLEHGRLDVVEVFARRHTLPAVLRPATSLVRPSEDLRLIVADDFGGPERPLDGRPIGNEVWTRTAGSGTFAVSGSGDLRVVATAASPLPGRVAYTFPNPGSGAVELEIDVVPPGTGRHHGEKGRAGVVFEQDDGNALIVSTWLDDEYEGASISSFFRLDGFEDLYDAIWTNVGDSVRWGRPYRLRVAFDGLVYEAFVDDELVLYRSLVDVDPRQDRLEIRRVGIVANWEWGTDTGSIFRGFEVRAGGADSSPDDASP